jgi:hypothetical protein
MRIGPDASAALQVALGQRVRGTLTNAVDPQNVVESAPEMVSYAIDTLTQAASDPVSFVGDSLAAVASGSVSFAGDSLVAFASDPMSLVTLATNFDPVSLAVAPVMIPLNMLDAQLKTWQENAPAGSSAQYVASTIGRVSVGVLRVGIPVGASFIPLAFGVPVPPTAAISAVGPLIREGMSFVQMAQARPRSAGTTTADAASANNETMTNDPTMMTKQRGMRSLMMGSSSPSSGGGAKYSTTLIDAVAAPGGDGRSVLAPGAASVPHRFFSPGLYLWHDQRNTAIHGVIVVEPSDIAVDACGVCGGDNSTCIDCLGVPHGAARLDACGVCSDPTAAGYTPNPSIDCAGVCHGSAALDECGECTGGTTGRLTGASMDCAGVCGGTARVDCEGVCGGSGRLDWHEGRPSSTIDISCTDNEGCCTQLSLPPPHSQLSHVFLYEG